MSSFVCQFRLASVVPTQAYHQDAQGETKVWKKHRAARVVFQGSQGEPFGSATPEAKCEMFIANTAVADLLLRKFAEYLGNEDTEKAPLYRVTFEPIHEDGAPEH